MKRIVKTINACIIIYLLYVIFTVILLPLVYLKVNDYNCDCNIKEFYGDEVIFDRVALVYNDEALAARINLINKAQESIYMSYFYINNDTVGKIILGELLQAADRNIKVRILIDGKYNKISGLNKDTLHALIIHPNIEIKLYETFKFLQPWTFNNFLHDKLLIIDNKIAMISGRNIGNRYFFTDVDNHVYDLDTIIINTNDSENSVITQMKDYFNYTWYHHYTDDVKRLNSSDIESGLNRQKEIIEYLNNYRKENQEEFTKEFNWEELSYPIKKINFVYNPLERHIKKPQVWCVVSTLINNADNQVFINSPYVVPTQDITKLLNVYEDLHINILTNSAASSPNILGISGYLRYKDEMLVHDKVNLYEYQGDGSLHSKTYIIDNRISVVGSYNLDPRSTYLSTESVLIIDSKEFSQALSSYYENKIESSLKTNGLFSYENNLIEPLPLPPFKKALLSIMRHVIILIEHLV